MAAPSLKPEPGVEWAEKDGQLVKLRGNIRGREWYVMPPPGVNEDATIGPFEDKELAIAVGACHMSWGEAF